MRAAVFVGQEQPLVIEDLAVEPPGPRDVVVNIGASGVCHSDLSIVHGYLPLPPNVVLGHEGAGTVEAIGDQVSRVKPGETLLPQAAE